MTGWTATQASGAIDLAVWNQYKCGGIETVLDPATVDDFIRE